MAATNLLLSGHGHEGLREQDAPHRAAYACMLRRRRFDALPQLALHRFRIFLRDNAAIQAEHHAVGHDVGIDAAGDQADGELRRADAGDPGHGLRKLAAMTVELRQNTGRRLQRIGARLRDRSVRRPSRYLDLEMQAAVVGRHDAVGEAGRDDEIRLGDALLEEIARPDQAARLLIEGEVQLHGARQRQTALAQGQQRIRVGGEIGFRHGNAAAIHDAVDDLGAVRWMRPPRARRHDIAMRVQRDRRPRPEPMPHDQIGGADHAVGGGPLLRNGSAFQPRDRGLRAIARRHRRSPGNRRAGCRTAHEREQPGTQSARRGDRAGIC